MLLLRLPRRRCVGSLSLALSLCLVVATCLIASGAHAQAARQEVGVGAGATPTETGAEDRGWPREFAAQGHVLWVHQPQVEEWPGFGRILFRAAFAVAPEGSVERSYGVIRCSADTEVSVQDRLVVLTNRTLESITFPDVEPAEADRLRAIVVAAMPPERPQTISLDRVVAEVAALDTPVRTVEVDVAPPKILNSEKPAILVVFLGKPRFKPVPGSEIQFAANTNWDVFFDPGAKRYYLLNDSTWLVSKDVTRGPWSVASELPAELMKLPADENWSDVRAALPIAKGADAGSLPTVFVVQEPAELIVTEGPPTWERIAGGELFVATNTDNSLFYHGGQRIHYLLAAGRWFRAASLAGPWSSASSDLPEAFRTIPEDSIAGDVLASVPGTVQAKEAVILASIPQKATVTKSALSLTVTYDGPPEFGPIAGTSLRYAVNSPYSVLLVDGAYYCCHDAVWFVAPAANGPWTVCDAVPKAIYEIPASSPMHNVTYVTVYESTPTTVVTGYTAGYSGETVAATGVVMLGLGILIGAAIDDDDCCWSYHYRGGICSYGCGAIYVSGAGGYVCGVRHYGPYGGAGRWAAYNPATGIYSRGGYVYGPNGAAGYRAAYNPSTGIAGYRAGGSNVYGSWGRGAVSNGEDWVRGGYRAGERGTVGGVQGSGGAGAVRVEGRFGNGVTVVRDRDGDIYAGQDGKVYRKTDGGWTNERSTGEDPKRGAKAPANTVRPPSEAGDLERDAANRDRGERNAARTKQVQRGDRPGRSGGGRGRR
jgi:hypothetical protein